MLNNNCVNRGNTVAHRSPIKDRGPVCVRLEFDKLERGIFSIDTFIS